MSAFKSFLAKMMKQLRDLASIILFTVYISIGVAHLLEVHNPRLMGGRHVAAGIAHLLN
jgi:hypothetical protein